MVLTNGQARREFDFLDDWQTVRIGMLLSFAAVATIPGSPRLKFGICAGVADEEGVADATTSHFLGMTTNSSDLTYNAGPTQYLDTGGSAQSIVKVGGTQTTISNALTLKFSADPTLVRSALFVEVVKGSPNFTVSFAGATSAGAAQTDITPALFLQMMEAASLSDLNAIVSGYTTGGHQSVAIDEATNGEFTGLNIYWDKASVGCEISEVRRRKMA